ncbi:hypothetical protein TGPRC2_203358C, partial [Toxoplasma gondii TgCatPRC2]
ISQQISSHPQHSLVYCGGAASLHERTSPPV